jgi:hypothetical protein
MGIYAAIIAYGAIGLVVCALGVVWKKLLRKHFEREDVREYRHSPANIP